MNKSKPTKISSISSCKGPATKSTPSTAWAAFSPVLKTAAPRKRNKCKRPRSRTSSHSRIIIPMNRKTSTTIWKLWGSSSKTRGTCSSSRCSRELRSQRLWVAHCHRRRTQYCPLSIGMMSWGTVSRVVESMEVASRRGRATSGRAADTKTNPTSSLRMTRICLRRKKNSWTNFKRLSSRKRANLT